MLETALVQLERVIADLLQQNQSLRETAALLEQQLQQAREENDTCSWPRWSRRKSRARRWPGCKR